jgi:hypothetical protein
MIGESRKLVTYELVEFGKQPVEVQNCRKFTDPFRGIYRMNPNLINEYRRMSTCNRLDLIANTRIPTGNAQKSSQSLLQPRREESPT